MDKSIFRAYDIRGIYPQELNERDAYKIARAVFEYAKPQKVAVGRDARLAAPVIHSAVARAFVDAGCQVTNLGMVSSDMAVFAAGTFDFDLVVMVTASHNPADWIGIKLFKRGGETLGGAGEIQEVMQLVDEAKVIPSSFDVSSQQLDILRPWIAHVLSCVDRAAIGPMRVAVDAANGVAGPIVRELCKHLPIELIEMYFEPDGNFPHHPPSPIEPKNMVDLRKKVVETNADVGVAFDGDADRIFLVDEKGQLVSGSEMTAMTMDKLLDQDPKRVVLYNAICGWNVRDVIAKYGATAYRTRVGHGFIKKDMKKHDAYFAGEHSGHYFFRNNFNADSGLIPMLLILALVSERGHPLSEILAEHRRYVSIPETNFRVRSVEEALAAIKDKFKGMKMDELDGMTIYAKDHWANIRPSQTEPLLRLNVEAINQKILDEKVQELMELIKRSAPASV